MRHLLPAFSALALVLCCTHAADASVTGSYIEARTCDIWTGPCFANAETNLAGKHAILGWMIDKGSFGGEKLDGLGVVAVIAASDTLGTSDSVKGKAILLVDSKATRAQKDALVKFAKKQGGDLVGEVVSVLSETISLDVCKCDDGGCGKLTAGKAKIETRCLHSKHDKKCGNESVCYDPLVKGVKAEPAMAVENSFGGKGIGATWTDSNRRGAYLGTFAVR